MGSAAMAENTGSLTNMGRRLHPLGIAEVEKGKTAFPAPQRIRAMAHVCAAV